MKQRQGRGYTLVELVIVVSVIALIAAIAIPATTSAGSEKQLRLAAEEFAAAMRFARSESLRTGKAHGFRFLPNEYRIRVFSADTSASPWTPVWDIYNPVDKALYDYTFPDDLIGPVTPVTQTPAYRGTCNEAGTLYFDEHGAPWCLEPETVLLDSYRLDLVAGGATLSVNLDGITGRVTVQ